MTPSDAKDFTRDDKFRKGMLMFLPGMLKTSPGMINFVSIDEKLNVDALFARA